MLTLEEIVNNYVNEDIAPQLPILYNICIEKNAKRILEFGVRGGISTKVFLDACKITNGILISVDIDDCSKVSNDPNWIFIQGDSTSITLHGSFNVILFDTLHTYEHILTELNRHHHLLRKGGVLLVHDINMERMREAIKHFSQQEKSYRIEYNDDGYGMAIMTKV